MAGGSGAGWVGRGVVTGAAMVVGANSCCRANAAAGLVGRPVVERGTEASKCGGGRVPRAARVDRSACDRVCYYFARHQPSIIMPHMLSG